MRGVPVIGYCLPAMPGMASYRLRVDIPRQYLALPSEVGALGDVCFFYKHAPDTVEQAQKAKKMRRKVVYDVVNDWFDVPRLRDIYVGMCELADVVTCGSEAMRRIIRERTGRDAEVVEEPYENEETAPHTRFDRVLWFGQRANLQALPGVARELKGMRFPLRVLSDITDLPQVEKWTPEVEREALGEADVVLLCGVNAGASANRMVKSLRAGCYVVSPPVESYREFEQWIPLGDVRANLEWAFGHPDAARERVRKAQAHIRSRFAPERIGEAWREVFLQAASS